MVAAGFYDGCHPCFQALQNCILAHVAWFTIIFSFVLLRSRLWVPWSLRNRIGWHAPEPAITVQRSYPQEGQTSPEVGVTITLSWQLYSNLGGPSMESENRRLLPPFTEDINLDKNLLLLGLLVARPFIAFISHNKSSFLAHSISPSLQTNLHSESTTSTWFPLPSKMVQRKATSKLGSRTEVKKIRVKAERHVASHEPQDTRSKGVGDRKRMKNYMKPTSSSDARKEQLPVSVPSPPAYKNRSTRNTNNLNYSKPSSSSSSGSTVKPVKILARKSSFKLVRPSMKKSSGVALHPKKLLIRATCSSTQKDSKFPKALDLHPGGSEAEGTSVARVCPYNYCSLNGHRHPLLPPLKSFLKERRSSLITHKSMKLKGLSPFEKKDQRKDQKEKDGRQMTVSGTPLIGEEENDFFVEIYARQQIDITKSEIRNEEKIQDIKELALTKDDQECKKSEFQKKHGNVALDEIDESYLNDGSDDGFDQKSDLSTEELDDIVNFLEYIECDKEEAEGEEEKQTSVVPEDYAEWPFECCCIVNVSSKESRGLAEDKVELPTCDATEIDWDEVDQCIDNKTHCSEFFDDGFDPTYDPFELDSTLITCQTTGDDPEMPHQVYEVAADRGDASASDTFSSKSNDVHFDCGSESIPPEPELSLGDHGYVEESSFLLSKEDLSYSGLMYSEEEAYKEADGSITDPERTPEQALPETIKNNSLGEAFTLLCLEVKEVLENEGTEHTIWGDGTEEEDGRDEVEENSSSPKIEQSDSIQGITEKEIDMTDQTEPGMEIYTPDDGTEDNKFLADVTENSERSEAPTAPAEDCDKPSINMRSKPKAKWIAMRRTRSEDIITVREFNPRPPQFLPAEPDPEAEKVDLRHQMMDERKNAEEWMIDYALQRAVTKLAPQKRKVALLVEAFETVMPLPMYEKPLHRAAASFAHSRPMQACS